MKKLLFFVTISGISLLIISPESLMAVETSSNSFGAEAISSHADKISDFIFGPLGKTAAILGGGYSFLTSITSGSPKPLIAFGAVGLMGAAIPTFVSKIYTLLLP